MVSGFTTTSTSSTGSGPAATNSDNNDGKNANNNANRMARSDSNTEKDTPSSSSSSSSQCIYSQHDDDPTLLFYHFPTTKSTQDEARQVVEQLSTDDDDDDDDSSAANTICITASEQFNGRGTSGRQWIGRKGNTFVTIAIRQSTWMDSSIPLTLLPLKIGSLVATRLHNMLQNCRRQDQNGNDDDDNNERMSSPKVSVKWPNDVLVNREKISGVLILETSTLAHKPSGIMRDKLPSIPPPVICAKPLKRSDFKSSLIIG